MLIRFVLTFLSVSVLMLLNKISEGEQFLLMLVSRTFFFSDLVNLWHLVT